MPSGSCSASIPPEGMNLERDTPRSRIPFVTGNCPLSKSKDTRSSAVRSSITLGNDRLRVICWKSAYLIFSVTVRPRASVLSQ
jgi:hypothetical protein